MNDVTERVPYSNLHHLIPNALNTTTKTHVLIIMLQELGRKKMKMKLKLKVSVFFI